MVKLIYTKTQRDPEVHQGHRAGDRLAPRLEAQAAEAQDTSQLMNLYPPGGQRDLGSKGSMASRPPQRPEQDASPGNQGQRPPPAGFPSCTHLGSYLDRCCGRGLPSPSTASAPAPAGRSAQVWEQDTLFMEKGKRH